MSSKNYAVFSSPMYGSFELSIKSSISVAVLIRIG